MIAEGVSLIQYHDAAETLLGRLNTCDGPQNFCELAEHCFCKVADEPLVYRILLTLSAEGLVCLTGRDVVSITAAGRRYVANEVSYVANLR